MRFSAISVFWLKSDYNLSPMFSFLFSFSVEVCFPCWVPCVFLPRKVQLQMSRFEVNRRILIGNIVVKPVPTVIDIYFELQQCMSWKLYSSLEYTGFPNSLPSNIASLTRSDVHILSLCKITTLWRHVQEWGKAARILNLITGQFDVSGFITWERIPFDRRLGVPQSHSGGNSEEENYVVVLTNSTGKNTDRKPENCSATQEGPCHAWNRCFFTVFTRLDLIPSQMDLIHAHPSIQFL